MVSTRVLKVDQDFVHLQYGLTFAFRVPSKRPGFNGVAVGFLLNTAQQRRVPPKKNKGRSHMVHFSGVFQEPLKNNPFCGVPELEKNDVAQN